MNSHSIWPGNGPIGVCTVTGRLLSRYVVAEPGERSEQLEEQPA